MTGADDDRRALDRDAAGTQPPGPTARPTPPEALRSRSWTDVKRAKHVRDLATRPREVVARAILGDTLITWLELGDDVKESYLTVADQVLDALAPLLPESRWRPYVARRDQQVARLELLVRVLRDHEDELVLENAQLRAVLTYLGVDVDEVLRPPDADAQTEEPTDGTNEETT